MQTSYYSFFQIPDGLLWSNFLNLIAAVLQYLGVLLYQPILLFVGRTIASIFTAVSFQANILYLQESPPTEMRGTISFLSENSFAAMTIVGMILGTNELLGNNLSWMMFVNVPPCLVAFVVIFFVPETPKFLLMKKKDRSAAEKSVRIFHGSNADVNAVLKETEIEASEEADCVTSFRHIPDLLREKHLRTALFLSCAALQNTVAFWCFIYNSTQFITDINIASGIAKWVSTGMSVMYFLATVVGSVCIDRLGRRAILIPFSFFNVGVIILFTICSQLQPVDGFKWVGLVAMLLFGLTYGMGVGAISWFISAELSPIKYRSLMQSACYSVNTIAVVISTFALLPLYGVIGSYAFLILYVLPSAFALYYITIYLPETKGKEIHIILDELRRA